MTESEERKLRLALRVITGQLGPASLNSQDMLLFGLDPDYRLPPDQLLYGLAEDVVVEAIKGARTGLQ